MEPRSDAILIKQKYFVCDRDSIQDPFINCIDQYLKRTKKRIYGFLPQERVKFIVTQTLDPPITLEIISDQSCSIEDLQLYLDGHQIEQFTIMQEMILNSTHSMTSNKSFQFSINLMIVAVRLMSQFTYIPTSYLIVQIIMLVFSLLYLIQEILRKKKN